MSKEIPALGITDPNEYELPSARTQRPVELVDGARLHVSGDYHEAGEVGGAGEFGVIADSLSHNA